MFVCYSNAVEYFDERVRLMGGSNIANVHIETSSLELLSH